MACAQTGSGKTAAFCFPIIPTSCARASSRRAVPGKPSPWPSSCPPPGSCRRRSTTRRASSRYQTGIRAVVVYGGAPVVNQLRDMERGCDLLVATPGRLSDLIERARVSLQRVGYLALDEADRMLDMGFEPQIRRIVEQRGHAADRRTPDAALLATFPKEIQVGGRLHAATTSSWPWGAWGRRRTSIVQHIEYVSGKRE